MTKDRSDLVAEIVARAIEAAEDGQHDKADDILRRAVHFGMRPIDIVLHALAAQSRDIEAPPPTEETSMRVVYDGPEEGVQLAPTLGDVWLPRGEAVELPTGVAESLLQQPNFRKPRRRRGAETPDQRQGETPESHDPTIETR